MSEERSAARDSANGAPRERRHRDGETPGPARLAHTFERMRAGERGAFVPFTVLGDPDPASSLEVIRRLVRSGADALELGIPFSDPIADGPVIQRASARARAAGARPRDAVELLARVREEFPELPLNLLVYANLVHARGVETFYREVAAAGADSVLVADVPCCECLPYRDAALAAGVAPILIAPPDAPAATLARIARLGRGYTYVLARSGVTGVRQDRPRDLTAHLAHLRELGAAPPLVGFGISNPAQVRAALAQGAAGVICGSAIVRLLEPPVDLAQLGRLVAELAAAAHFGGAPGDSTPESFSRNPTSSGTAST